jgi:hypothetical protein
MNPILTKGKGDGAKGQLFQQASPTGVGITECHSEDDIQAECPGKEEEAGTWGREQQGWSGEA